MAAKAGVRDTLDAARLADLAQQALDEARRHGATAAEAATSDSRGLSVTARMGEVETVEHNRDRSLVVTVYVGQKTGSASSSDFSPAAIVDTARAACTIAKYTAEDPCAGLADPDRLARACPDLDLNHHWDVSVDEAVALALTCEDRARKADKRITNSEGATVSSHAGVDVYANTLGFMGEVAATRHSISCAVVGSKDGQMQRDYWYTAARDPAELEEPEDVGRTAAQRTLRRLGARKIATRETPVIYEAPVAGSLLSHFVGAVRGTSLYRKASYLLDQLNQPVFAPHVRIHEQPHLHKAMGSAAFDNDGVATQPRDLVRDGVLLGYVLDTYSGRKLGMPTTGNAGGVHNLTLAAGPLDFAGLLKEMGTGLLVTELIGHGVNNVTGDYSRGATGFWVEDGELCYPVEEITVAGNLKRIFRQIRAVGNDVDARGNIRTGSILVDRMTVAGT